MIKELMKAIDENCINVDKNFIVKAYELARDAHVEQKRESGEPYIIHPVEVATILAEMGLDENVIAASLLHDVIEDTEYTFQEIENLFNTQVATLVEGVTKLGKIKYQTKEERQAESVRKMLFAMTKDIRVILIKLADRLHNMRTLKFMSVEKQKEKAKETLDIYAPLAHRLGMSKIKWELEDLSLRYMHPEEYYQLVNEIAEKREERELYISNITSELITKLSLAGIEIEIDGRPKHFYSIYRKMVIKNKKLEEIFDLTAIRILVEDIKDCYAALGIVHTMYKPIPGRFKDYIAMPKPNMYQSLHTTVIGPEGKPFEIQIRTFDMHRTSEYGIAAHWKYKQGSEGDREYEEKLTWLRETLEWQRETSNAEEFMEDFKIDMFSDEIFVFTPNGKVINLPYHSTPIDFAYRIHTDVGHKCSGAKVNGKLVPLDYHLKTGEIVEINTSSHSKGPSLHWLKITQSNQARSKIKAWFKKQQKEETLEKGKEFLEKESKKQGYSLGELTKGKPFEKFLDRYHMNNLEELYVTVGNGNMLAATVIAKILKYSNKKENVDLEALKEQLLKETKTIKKKKSSPGIMVKGIDNVLVRFAKCCTPVPGDDIIGYITKGRGVSVHRKDCLNVNNLINTDSSRMVQVSWEEKESIKDDYITGIEIKAEDRTGLLADLMEIIANKKVSLYAVNVQPVKANIAYVTLKVKIQDIKRLEDIMKQLKYVRSVISVYRTKS
ncbi:RelA/SpoT family protein [Clostridium grantii]|uniref:GTP diphosphokinase n=1 Tax=Clostridium grantii DSM 8605 TaxID=1121316 RepID=A0A1M5SJ74_9CLOT|nr:bifunctional (p)ppGpp synthetase/guanosine-3',5'-bis(diphosphate) 3'-pyrophosphohydrolase [Clostridium grantii]SHH38614.1 GTP pyrophosphokinase [Clostridium grantii DSM 8605]